MNILSKAFATTAIAATIIFGAGAASAGPFILAGTDADDHGSATATANRDGWLFMQRAIENLSTNVTNGNKVVVSLGSSSSAAAAASSAFTLSSLPGAGWSFVSIQTSTGVANFFTGTGAGTIGTAGIVMLDSGGNVSGGLNSTSEATLTANASQLNGFLGAGGGLFSQANGYGFLSALVPGLTLGSESNTGIELTAAGNASFPGLTNADLSAGPYHNNFGNVGAIPVLGIGTSSRNPVIIGSNAGSITAPQPPSQPPTSVPEPASMVVLATGLFAAGFARRRKA